MTTTKESYKGLFPYWLVKSINPSNIYIHFFHGFSQDGPADGSLLDRIANAPGWLNWIVKFSREYPDFNFVFPQFLEVSTGDPSTAIIRKHYPTFIREVLPPDAVNVATGWSYGAAFALNWALQGMLGYEDNEWVKCVVAFAGKGSGSPNYAGVNKPICLVSGTNDGTVNSYNKNEQLFNLITTNSTSKLETVLITIPGGDHDDAPRLGTDQNSEYGKQVIDFITRHSKSDVTITPVQDPAMVYIEDGKLAIFVTEAGSYKIDVMKI